MPDLSQTTPAVFPLQGGLVLNKSTFAMQPGEALELVNFEPDIGGGYRRISLLQEEKKYTLHQQEVGLGQKEIVVEQAQVSTHLNASTLMVMTNL
jgi:hypothetical protein